MGKHLGPLRKSEIILGFCYWGMYLIGLPLLLKLLLQRLGHDLSTQDDVFLLNMIFGLCNLAAVALIFRHFLADQFRRMRRGRTGRTIATIAIGLGMIYGGNLAVSVLQQIVTRVYHIDYVNQNQEIVEHFIRDKGFLSVLLVMLSAPVVEECLNRGLIFGLMRRRTRFWAYAVSMLVFSGIHCWNAAPYQPVIVTVLNVMTYLPAGFALAWVYDRTESVWPSIILHLVNNTISMAALLLLSLLEKLMEKLGGTIPSI